MRNGFGRRSFLQSVGYATFGLGATSTASALAANTVEVPTLVSGDDPVHQQAVPEEWVEHVRSVDQAREKMGQITEGANGVAGFKVVRSDQTHGGRDGLRLDVELSQPNIDLDLPQEVKGIPVETQLSAKRGLSACFNDGKFDQVPGGVIVEPNESGAFGTACCRVEDGGEPRLLTAAHVWRSCEGGIDVGSPAYQGGRHLGQVARYDTRADVALVEADRSIELDDSIKLEDETRLSVGGVVSDWGLAVLLTSDEFVQNIGTSSGLTKGQLTAKDVEDGWNECIDFDSHGVEANHKNVVGDSGGPVFYTYEGECFLVSLQQMWLDKNGTDCDEMPAGSRGRGTAAAHVKDKLGVTFGS